MRDTYTHQLSEALADIGDAVCVTDVTGKAYTGASLDRHIEAIASMLDSIGLAPGDGLAQLASNSVDAFAIMAACLRAGVRYTPLHAMGSIEQQRYIVQDAGVTALVVDTVAFEQRGSELKAHFPDVAIITLSTAGYGRYLHDLLTDRPPLTHQPSGDDIAWITYTGGTTGEPKGVIHTQASMAATAELSTQSWEFPDMPRYLACSPISHAAGFLVLPVLRLGGTVLLLPSFSPEAVIACIEERGISVLFLVPSMIYALLDHPGIEQRDLSNLEHIIYASAPIDPERLREAIHLFGPILFQCYGQTESIHIACMDTKDHNPGIPGRLKSAGRATPGMSVQVVDAAGRRAATGEVGEICVQGPALLKGYWRKPEESKKTLARGWLHTGDLGFIDEHGFLFIVDRLKDMIISGGFNIYSRDVEQALLEHPSVREVAAVGLPDDRWGERVHALVVLQPQSSCSAEELIAFVRERSGPLLTPKSLVIADALPRTNLGKVDKKAIKSANF